MASLGFNFVRAGRCDHWEAPSAPGERTFVAGTEWTMVGEAVALNAVQEYWIDVWQRGVLILDALNQRGNTHMAEAAKEAPHVLSFDVEVLLDGRTLERPVNYA